MSSSRAHQNLPVKRRPMLALAFCILSGTALGLRFAVEPLIPLTAGLLFVLLAVCLRHGSAGSSALLTAWVCAACAVSSMARVSPSGRSMARLVAPSGEYMDVIGIVHSEPSVSEDADMQWFLLNVEGIRRIGVWQLARGSVWTRLRSGAKLAYGDRVICSGLIRERDAGFRVGAAAHSLLVDAGDLRVLDFDRGVPLVSWCLRGRERCAEILTLGIEKYPQHTGLLMALLLGYRQSLPRDLREAFATTGTLHIFAISGLHVGVVAVLIILVLKTCGLSREHWVLCLLPLLVIYTLSTGMKVSAVRACVMAVVYWSACLFRRKPDGPSSLALAAAVILLFAPHQLIDPGFILSFIVVSGIMLLYPRFARVLGKPFRRDPWKIERDPFWIRWSRTAAYYLSDVVAVSLAAWLASAPLTAVYFNLFSPAALLGNVLVVPGSFLVVFTGCLSLLLGASFPLCAEVFNHANRMFISILLTVVGWVRAIPGGHAYVRTPPWTIVALWYGAVLALIVMRGKARIVAMSLLVSAAVLVMWDSVQDDAVRVDVLEVRQGNAVFVDLPGRQDMLFDTGPAYMSNTLIGHLRRQGVNKLKVLVLSHPDINHIGAALDVVRSIPVEEVWCPPFKGRSKACEDLMTEIARRRIPVRHLCSGDGGVLPGGVSWEVFHPCGDGRYGRGDDASLVLRVGRGEVAVLLMGGAGARVEQEIISRAAEPSATVLIPGVQKGRSFCTESWVNLVEPQLVVLGASAFSQNRASEQCLRDRLEGLDIDLWDVGWSGPVRLEWGGKGHVPGRPNPFRVIPLAH